MKSENSHVSIPPFDHVIFRYFILFYENYIDEHARASTIYDWWTPGDRNDPKVLSGNGIQNGRSDPPIYRLGKDRM